MKITTLPILILVIGVMFVGFYAVLTDFATQYDVEIDESYNKYDSLDALQKQTSETKEGIGDELKTDKNAQFFTGTWDAITKSITITYNSFEIATNTTQQITEDIGVPVYVTNVLLVILVILVIALVVAMILRFKQ